MEFWWHYREKLKEQNNLQPHYLQIITISILMNLLPVFFLCLLRHSKRASHSIYFVACLSQSDTVSVFSLSIKILTKHLHLNGTVGTIFPSHFSKRGSHSLSLPHSFSISFFPSLSLSYCHFLWHTKWIIFAGIKVWVGEQWVYGRCRLKRRRFGE